MAAPPPVTRADRRHRPRRGSLERPVSGRIYRAAWALVAVPLLISAFTVGRPEPLPPPRLPPSFDQQTAAQLARELATLHPDRTPGSAEGRNAARWVSDHLAEYNLSVEERAFEADVPGLGTVDLVNVIARPLRVGPQRSPEAIVVVAHRDNVGSSPGANDNASGTAALIELARNLSTLSLAHTIIFVSTDGGAYGNIGAARLAADPSFRRDVLAVVNLDALAGEGPPRLEFAGDDPRSPVAPVLATADASVLAHTGAPATRPSAFSQLLDLAFPFSLYDQAPFLGADVSAVTLTSAGSRPAAPEGDTPAALNAGRLGSLGRSAQALIMSLDDAAEVARGSASSIYLGGRFVGGFAIQLLLYAALVPVLFATLDLFARLRRRGVRFGPAFRSYRTRLSVWLVAGGLFGLFSVTGIFPSGASRPVPPDTAVAQNWPFAALAALAGLSAAAWFIARVRLVPRRAVERGEELAGHLAAMVALCAACLFVAVTDPFSLLFFLPAAHAWLWAPHVRDRSPLVRAALYSVGFAGPVLLLSSFAFRFDLGLDAIWYVAVLFSVGYAPVTLFLAFLGWGAVAGQVGAILFGHYAPYPSSEEGPAPGLVRAGVRRSVLVGRRLRRARRQGTPDAELWQPGR